MSLAEAWEAIHTERQWGVWPNEHFVRFVAQHYRGRSQTRFLELGCGAGAQLRFLASEGFEAWGIDHSAKAVERANDLLALEGVDELAFATHQSVTDMTEVDPKFDCIVDIACLQHVPFDKAHTVINRARSWLNPGGRFFSIMASAATDNAVSIIGGLERRAFLHEIEVLFSGYRSVAIGDETVNRPAGSTIVKWIIHAGLGDG